MHRQDGISMMGFLGFLIVGCLLAFIAMRLFPVYSEHHSVVTSMRGVAADPAASGQDPAKVRSMLSKRLRTSYVDSVKPEHVKIVRTDGGYDLVVSYEVRRPLAYNLDFVAKFEDRVSLRRNGSVP